MPQQFNEILDKEFLKIAMKIKEQLIAEGLKEWNIDTISGRMAVLFNQIYLSDLSKVRQQTIDEVMACRPEERDMNNLPFETKPEIYGNQRLESYKKGHNFALKSWTDEIIKITI